MLEVVPYELDDIKNELKRKAMDELGISDAEFEGSHISQLINILAYANVVNNTNFTYGLNEMFISQAKDRKNVIKHARQMGYTHKRKISYQYKIKLKAIKSGSLTISKYMEFATKDNNYIYMGESITESYGTYGYLRSLTNEYNNSLSFIIDKIEPGDVIINEEQKAFKILDKDLLDDNSPKLLLKGLDDAPIDDLKPESNLPKKIFYWDGTRDPSTGYRNLEDLGDVDTFLVDPIEQIFKVQLSTKDNNFPAFSIDDLSTTVTPDLEFETPTEFPIKYIISITATVNGEPLDIDLNTLDYEEGDKNAKFPQGSIGIEEKHTAPDITNIEDNNAEVLLNKEVIPDSVIGATVNFPDGRTRKLDSPCVQEIPGNKVVIQAQYSSIEEEFLATDLVDGNKAQPSKDNVRDIRLISLIDEDGNKKILDNFIISEDTNQIQILDNGCVVVADLADTDVVKIDYEYFENLEEAEIVVDYSFLDDSLIDSPIEVEYAYDVNNDGVLDSAFFFSDLRGENELHEVNFDPVEAPDGFDGFKAISWDPDTQVLTFSIKPNENEYVSTDKDKNPIPVKQIHQVLTSPFRKTRFSKTTKEIDANGDEYYTAFNSNTCFSALTAIELKNEKEIIVKEGTIRRYNEVDEGNKIVNRDLRIAITAEMVNAGHFVIYGKDIENDGIELFITRGLPDGSKEIEVPWKKRAYLLAEKGVNDYSFIDLPDVNYEDYVNVYTRYAGAGDPLKDDFICKLNVLSSKGSQGFTSEIIEPVDSLEWEGMPYYEYNNTPNVLFVEGSDEETTDSIRKTAPLFSNTANRAVTKSDYKTICESLSYIDQAQVWGGEEETPKSKPGNVYISVIPYSRPKNFIKKEYSFVLEKYEAKDLFYSTYQQITGKNSYTDLLEDKSDQNILFNVLDNYKIITLQLNYVKPIYLDYDVSIKILKYNFSKSISETHQEMFQSVYDYFSREIEKYNSTFYRSSLVREIDSILGDDYGVKINVKTKVALFDDKRNPDLGVFRNYTNQDLSLDSDGFIGLKDTFIFELALDYPIEDLFENNILKDAAVVYLGKLLTSSLSVNNTKDFLEDGDSLELLLDDSKFNSLNDNSQPETTYASSFSSVIEIPIMYKPTGTAEEYGFKVGSYTLYKSKKVMILRLFTKHYSADFYNGTGPIVSINHAMSDEANHSDISLGYNAYNKVTVKESTLPRQEFYNRTNIMNISAYSDNISYVKNVFPRLTSVNFIVD